MDEIHILQLGNEDWNHQYTLPQGVSLDYVEDFGEGTENGKPEKTYDLLFLDRAPREEEFLPLHRAIRAHTLFVTEHVAITGQTEWFCRCKQAQHIRSADVQDFLLKEAKYYFPKPYGAKLNLKDVAIAQEFAGKVKWNGNYEVILEGEFGEEFRQAAFWRYNIFLEQGKAQDLWLEYSKDPTVSIFLEVTQFARGSISEVIAHWEFDETDLQQVIRLESTGTGSAFLSVSAKGNGKLSIVALHTRNSRGSHGYFLPGGERCVSHRREEAFCYFDPGDLKPPLCVYFSGYKTLQGFEGYHMMREMGCPFLLIAEPRLEGGGFYMGSIEYEYMYIKMIQKHMKELGFRSDQVIFSGLSMGTYGALYYGCDIRPHAILLGKPLASIGNVTANEKYSRPGGFPTSLDVLRYQCGALDKGAVKALNVRFWRKFKAADWGNTKFAISYMIEDDYDSDAYQMLISHIQSEGAQVYGKGLHGRHNDNTGGIVNWFLDQYATILAEDFGRGKK